jgi:hypothetical protein
MKKVPGGSCCDGCGDGHVQVVIHGVYLGLRDELHTTIGYFDLRNALYGKVNLIGVIYCMEDRLAGWHVERMPAYRVRIVTISHKRTI